MGCENTEVVNDDGSIGHLMEHGKVDLECSSMPKGCSALIWPWAVGAPELVMPPGVGFPMGGQGKAKNWLVLQAHYYNPDLHENVRDSSGVRFSFTEDLRPQEAAISFISSGSRSYQRPPMPAGEKNYELSPFIIPSSCTVDAFATPITILGVGNHMHLAGLRTTMELQRDGVNLGPMRSEKYYDFNHQSSEPSFFRTLLPGDQINMHCHFDTSSHTEDVSFGEGSNQEMCLATLFYYPKQEDLYGLFYHPLALDSALCTEPGTGGDLFVNVSRCAQTAFEDVATFHGLEASVNASFDALSLCNSDYYEIDVLPLLSDTEACPACYKNKTCTAKEVLDHAQNKICKQRCALLAGVSLYPDVSQVDGYDQGIYGCNGGNGGVQYFKQPKLEAYVCEPMGDLTQVIELQAPIATVDETVFFASSGLKSGQSAAFAMLVVANAAMFF